MRFFIQMNINVWKSKKIVGYSLLKGNNNCVKRPCVKSPFYVFLKTLDEIKEKLSPK
jgi:hypothetical protein